MSVWWDKDKGRFCIRIKRRGQMARRILPQGTTRQQAEQIHIQILREFVDIAELGKKPAYTIADAMQRYAEEELPKLRSNRKSDIAQIRPYTVGRPLSDIPAAAQDYRQAHQHLTPASRNRRCHVLRRVANLAYRWGWLDKPLYVAMEPENNARHTYLSIKEIKAVLKAIGDPEAKAFATVAAYTGMRRGEICGLQEGDIGREYLTVRHSKTGKPRQVPIVPEIRASLKLVPFGYHKDTYSKMAAQAGVRLHDLRHSTASLLINSGASLELVGQVLGHTSVQTTRRYAHLAPQAAKAAMLKMTGTNIAPAKKPKKRK